MRHKPPLHSCSSWLARAMSRWHSMHAGLVTDLARVSQGSSAYPSLAHLAIKQPHVINKSCISINMRRQMP